jgi:hypothetical protein
MELHLQSFDEFSGLCVTVIANLDLGELRRRKALREGHITAGAQAARSADDT